MAEGNALLKRHTVSSCIEGSNPSLSAKSLLADDSAVTGAGFAIGDLRIARPHLVGVDPISNDVDVATRL